MLKLLLSLVFLLIVPISLAQKEGSTVPMDYYKIPIEQVMNTCNEGETRCNENLFQTCQGNAWQTLQKCSANEFCDSKQGCSGAQPIKAQPKEMPKAQIPPPTQIKTPGTIAPTLPGIPLPGLEITSTRINCPTPRRTKVKPPVPPYDLRTGDCALIGRGAEIEAYLRDLEAIARDCHSGVETNWQHVRDERARLEQEINQIIEQIARQERSVEGPERVERASILLGSCTLPSRITPLEPTETEREGWHYTTWLKRMGENTIKYCKMIDELIKPIIEACEDANHELDCLTANGRLVSEAERNSFRSASRLRLNGQLNAAFITYNYTEFYYTNTLQTYGWGAFRADFNENLLQNRCLSSVGLPQIEGIDVNQQPRQQGFFGRISSFFRRLFGR